MPEEEFDNKDEIRRLINSAFDDQPGSSYSAHTVLRAKFEKKIAELGISINQVRDNLDIEQRTLNGILDGTQKRIDVLAAYKIAQFLGMDANLVMNIFLKSITDQHKGDINDAKRRAFILNNFDLPTLKSAGIIDSIRDFDEVEKTLNSIFGLDSILNYETEDIETAFSSTKVIPKKLHTRKYFVKKSKTILQQISNPNPYDKDALIDQFAKIRWQSTDVNKGLLNVMRTLFELGITVIFQPKMPQLQVRGATFALNKKPCIVFTNYRNSYPTIWFAILHELFHVLFDWPDILAKKYHISDEESDLFVVRQKEEEANEFAREFLFPNQKMERIKEKLSQKILVREFAKENHVHESIIYANHAWQYSSKENNLWIQYERFMPDIEELITIVGGGLSNKSTAKDFADFYKHEIYNNL